MCVSVTPALAHRFVFITGDTANAEAWAFLEDARVPVIEKPFPPALFEDAVARVMAGGSPARVKRTDLVAILAREARGSKGAAERALGRSWAAFAMALRNGGSVTISGFGTFVVARRASRGGRHPRTGKAITIPSASRPALPASRGLKAAVR